MNTKRTVLVACIGLLGSLVSAVSLGADPSMLGLTPPEVIDRLGSPVRVYVASSEVAELETVVFFYDDYRYVYFHDNRVWQIRVDERSDLEVLGISAGTSRRDVLLELGPAVHEDDESAVFELEDRGFPVRARFFFRDDSVVDSYVYRADY